MLLDKNICELFAKGYNCSKIVASHFAEKYGVPESTMIEIVCGFGGGMRKAEVCGAVTGGIMVIGMKYGNQDASDDVATKKCYLETTEFEEAFHAKEGSLLCRDLLSCDISTAEGMEYATKSNLFPTTCPKMILSAIKILEERGF